MRVVKATLFFLVVAATAHGQAGRHRAIGWPFPLAPCAPGLVAFAPGVGDFALDGASVYFGDNNGSIWRVPKDGGVPPALLGHIGDNLEVFWIEADATRLYFAAVTGTQTADFYSMPKAGGAITTLVAGALTPAVAATDAQFVYWVSVGTLVGEEVLSDGAVRRVAKTGGAVQTIVSGLSFPIALAVAGGSVYYGETGIAIGNTSAGLRRVGVDGGTPVKLFDGAPVGSIAVDATNAYFAVYRLVPGLVDIDRVAIAGGAVAPLVVDLDFADGLVVQGNQLYYAAETSERSFIAAVNVAGGEPRPVKTVELPFARLAFDECLVYYATAFDSIARAAK